MSDDQSSAKILFSGSGWVFLFALVLSTTVGFFIQLVLLPYVLPGIHAGHGLLAGGDWVGFHADAVSLAQRILNDGWSRFELRPQGQAPVALAAIIYLKTGIREPWILVPLHGFVFALGIMGLFNIYRRVAGPWLAALATAPLALAPSSVLLYSQIHKDVWSITGSIWLFAVLIAYASLARISVRQHFALLAIATAAAGLVWLMRAYLLQILFLGGLTAAVFLFVWTLMKKRNLRDEMPRWVGIGLCSFLMIAGALDVPTRLAGHLAPRAEAFLASPNPLEGERPVFTPTMAPPVFEATLNPQQRELFKERKWEELTKTLTPEQLSIWQKWQMLVKHAVDALTPDQKRGWVPAGVQRRIEAIIHIRRGYMLSGMSAGSAIDFSAPIRNTWEVLLYIPRALQIGLFAPFPDLWFRSGVSPGSGAMRAAAGIETIISYVLFVGFLPLLFLSDAEQRKRVIFSCVLVLPAICLFAITVPNVGTLYRMRYGYLHILVGFGLVGWGFALVKYREMRGQMSGLPLLSSSTSQRTES